MQPCDELKNLVLQNYAKEGAGEVMAVVESYSRQDGVTVLGTDPKEWFEGYDAIQKFYAPVGASKLEVNVDVLKAYCEGNVGWTIDRVMVRFPNGDTLPLRHTRIFEKEKDGWRIVHNHVSLAVPDEQVDKLFAMQH